MNPSALGKWLLGFVVPHSIVMLRARAQRRNANSRQRDFEASHGSSNPRVYSYERSIGWLVDRGLDEAQVRAGSVPESSLDYIKRELTRTIPSGPVTALHIGNFVGVSLCFLVNELRLVHPDSLVIAVDPNISHRGIENPQSHVAGLLAHFGLQKNAMLVCGYSLGKNLGDDGGILPVDEEGARARFSQEAACENVISNLGHILARKVDLVLIDGNHDGRYLASELKAIRDVLRPGGVLILDDVSESWFEIKQTFEMLSRQERVKTVRDGRVGIAVLA